MLPVAPPAARAPPAPAKATLELPAALAPGAALPGPMSGVQALASQLGGCLLPPKLGTAPASHPGLLPPLGQDGAQGLPAAPGDGGAEAAKSGKKKKAKKKNNVQSQGNIVALGQVGAAQSQTSTAIPGRDRALQPQSSSAAPGHEPRAAVGEKTVAKKEDQEESLMDKPEAAEEEETEQDDPHMDEEVHPRMPVPYTAAHDSLMTKLLILEHQVGLSSAQAAMLGSLHQAREKVYPEQYRW